MFAVPASSLLLPATATRSLSLLRPWGTSAIPNSLASGRSFGQKSGEQKRAKPRESCQASQNEHLQKSSHNSREMNTYMKVARRATAANVFFAANVIPWNELRGVNKVGAAYHEARSNRRHQCNSFGFTSLCKPSAELPRNDIVNKKGGGGGPLALGSDPFAITTDRAMINVA